MKLEDLTILYAEDEQGIRNTVTDVLELYVNKVVTASNGQEALSLYDQYKPSIILLDICMPNKDGLDVLKQIRVHDTNTPVIMMTAHTENEYLMRAVELYITRYLVKPFNKDTLLEALNECLDLLCEKKEEQMNLGNGIIFDTQNQEIIKENVRITLNKKERLLLNLLLKNNQKILTYEALEYHIWDDMTTQDALKSLIKDLRKKTYKTFIKNISGLGYKIELENV
jgi:DNA-binding response OmpR family regulator